MHGIDSTFTSTSFLKRLNHIKQVFNLCLLNFELLHNFIFISAAKKTLKLIRKSDNLSSDKFISIPVEMVPLARAVEADPDTTFAAVSCFLCQIKLLIVFLLT